MDVYIKRIWLLLYIFLDSTSSQAVDMTVYSDPTASNTESVHLGGLFPVRHSRNKKCGELRGTGVGSAEAMVFAIRAINADSSILPNINLTFDIRDTCFISNIALESSIGYVQNLDSSCANATDRTAVSGVVGPAASTSSASTATFFRLFQIPQVSHASTAALLSDSTVFDYFFRTIPSDSFQARAMVDLIEVFNWTYIFALYSDDTYGREGIESLISILQGRNNTARRCIALRAALPSSSTDSEFFDGVVQDMSREWIRNASVAVLFGHPLDAIAVMDAIVRAANDSSLLRITWIASDSWATALPEAYHNLARGMLSFLPNPGNTIDFRNYIDNLNPATSANPWLREYFESAFNCSLEEPSCSSKGGNLSHFITNQFTTNIIDGVYAFAHAVDQMIVDHCPNGRVCDKIATVRFIGRSINGTLLRDYLYNVSFPSTFSSESADLLFDSNGDVQGSYLIKNLQFTSESESSFQTIGTWNHINLLQFTGNIEWNDGGEIPPQSVCSLPCEVGHEPRRVTDQEQCCWTCAPCLGSSSASSGEICIECGEKMTPNSDRSDCIEIPVTYFTWSSPWAVIILCLTCIGIAVTIFNGVMLLIFHHRSVIKASSRELSALILAGILLCYILPFLFVVRPTHVVCGVRRFAVGFCFAISYSALLIRSNRIYRIFKQPTSQISKLPRFISSTSQVVLAGGLISIQVLIAVVWLAVERPSVDIKQVDARTVELRCGESPYYGLSVSLVYNLFLLILSTYFAFLTRKVPDNFNEAKYINITLYSLCVIWVGFIPAYYVSIQFGTVYESFFLLLAVLSSASATLFCILVPKIFIVFREKKMQQPETNTKTSLSVIPDQPTTSL